MVSVKGRTDGLLSQSSQSKVRQRLTSSLHFCFDLCCTRTRVVPSVDNDRHLGCLFWAIGSQRRRYVYEVVVLSSASKDSQRARKGRFYESSVPILQGNISREELMRLIPQVAASVGVESQQLEAAMLLALDASTERTYGWSMGLRLKLGHLCRHVFLILLVSQHRCAMSQDVPHVAHHSFAEPSAAEHVL